MSDTVIKVSNISKRYRLGMREQADTFAAQLKNTLLYPIRNWQNIRRMKRFDDDEDPSVFWALRDINFEVKRGEVLGIIGHNGAGKSTLLKILSRITEPTSGQIEIKGRLSSLLEVGTGFHPELTGRENVYMNGTILGMTKKEIDQKFDEIVAFAGVDKHIDTPVKFYSSGMQVRLGFSVAAHLEPEILVIDEVLAVGDFEFQKRCLGKMDDVAKSGRTVLFVSHNMAAVRQLCNTGISLRNGFIETWQDNIEKVIDSYLSSNINVDVTPDISIYKQMETDGFKITSVKVENLDRDSEELGVIRIGDGIVISIIYEASKEFISPSLVISCNDSLNSEIFRLSNMPISGFPVSELYNVGIFQCVIEQLPMTDGIYYFDIGFVRERVEWYFNSKNVVKIEIQPHDVYRSGFSLDKSRGSTWVKHEWRHRKVNGII